MPRGLKREGIDPKRKPGRPPKVEPEVLLDRLEKYIEETDLPIISEFAYQNGYARESLYDIPEISHALRKLITKREFMLERRGFSSTSMAEIRMVELGLKQLGWADKHDVKMEASVVIVDDIGRRG